jgi:DNA-binding transcriptional ArsR family regulator
MVNRYPTRLDGVFRALADPTRRSILARVVRSDCTVAELSRPFGISPPAISRHLRILEDAGLLRRVRTGKFHRFKLRTPPLTEVQVMLSRLTAFWEHRLDHLEAFLEDEPGKATRQDA